MAKYFRREHDGIKRLSETPEPQSKTFEVHTVNARYIIKSTPEDISGHENALHAPNSLLKGDEVKKYEARMIDLTLSVLELLLVSGYDLEMINCDGASNSHDLIVGYKKRYEDLDTFKNRALTDYETFVEQEPGGRHVDFSSISLSVRGKDLGLSAWISPHGMSLRLASLDYLVLTHGEIITHVISKKTEFQIVETKRSIEHENSECGVRLYSLDPASQPSLPDDYVNYGSGSIRAAIAEGKNRELTDPGFTERHLHFNPAYIAKGYANDAGRIEAIKWVDDIDVLINIAETDPEPKVRAEAEARLKAM